MNISIERIQLHLPVGFEQRADSIARLLGDELGRLSWRTDYRIDHLTVAPQTVAYHHSDARIAGQLAQTIHAQVTKGGGGCSR
ncbi:MAG: hypothetical protein BA864_11285 [Desulfuromonadales bacterium C00003093]|nr:MAG: hypothetical protein BA864_11285 [Desulfuromonadales bacterium C00003093]